MNTGCDMSDTDKDSDKKLEAKKQTDLNGNSEPVVTNDGFSQIVDDLWGRVDKDLDLDFLEG